jgi:RND family efflux transporter MFP subunit
MKRLLQILLPLLVLACSLWFGRQIILATPEATRREPPQRVTEVEAMPVQRQSHQVQVSSQGTVQPRTESTLLPELAGRVVELAANFQSGGFFERGDVLVRIDPRDYDIAVTVAESELARANAALAEEQARAKVAEREWQQLKRAASANQLALRKPQVAAARASVLAAEAQLARAKLNLERTRIIAPFAGRVLEENVSMGQYVTPGTVLARIFAVDYVEVRLPLSNRQLAFVDLPEQYREDSSEQSNTTAAPLAAAPTVVLTAQIGASEHRWQGRIIRAEGAIDVQSRQLFVLAQVDDPYGRGPTQRPPLRIGQFVQASIAGRTLSEVFVIPRVALREGNQVLLVDQNEQLLRRTVEVIWGDSDNAVISEGLQNGDRLVLTPLSTAAEGTPVKVRSEETQPNTQPNTPTGQESRRSTRATGRLNQPAAALQSRVSPS